MGDAGEIDPDAVGDVRRHARHPLGDERRRVHEAVGHHLLDVTGAVVLVEERLQSLENFGMIGGPD
jgi:hypothetical protein